MPLLMSCQTTRTEYIYLVPEVDFPDFPVCEHMEKTQDGQKVTVDGEWFVEVAKFKNEIESIESYLNSLRDKYRDKL